jgi:hypothetical protein
MSSSPENTDRKQGGAPPFAPGQSGNPAGRPKGARNKASLAIEALLEGEAEALSRKAVELALSGDTVALRLCLDRIAPPRKDRHVTFDLPAIDSASNGVHASSAVLAAVANGELTPSEASEIVRVIEAHVKTLEAAEFEERLAKLEKRMGR